MEKAKNMSMVRKMSSTKHHRPKHRYQASLFDVYLKKFELFLNNNVLIIQYNYVYTKYCFVYLQHIKVIFAV